MKLKKKEKEQFILQNQVMALRTSHNEATDHLLHQPISHFFPLRYL